MGSAGIYYPWLLATMTRNPNLLNFARNANAAADQADAIYARNPVAGDRHFYLVGTADRAINGCTPAALQLFSMILGAEVTWLACDKKVANVEGAWTWSGAWLPGGAYGGIGKYSVTPGDYAEATFMGDVCRLGYTVENSWGKSFTLSIDGVERGTYSAGPPTGIVSAYGRPYAPALAAVSGCGPGQHTARLTVNPGYGAVEVDWLSTGPNGLPLYLLTLPVTSDPGVDLAISIYNGVIRAVATSAADDGLNVTVVDTGSAIDRATDLCVTNRQGLDGIHPNSSGHMKMTIALLDALPP